MFSIITLLLMISFTNVIGYAHGNYCVGLIGLIVSSIAMLEIKDSLIDAHLHDRNAPL